MGCDTFCTPHILVSVLVCSVGFGHFRDKHCFVAQLRSGDLTPRVRWLSLASSTTIVFAFMFFLIATTWYGTWTVLYSIRFCFKPDLTMSYMSVPELCMIFFLSHGPCGHGWCWSQLLGTREVSVPTSGLPLDE